MPFATPTPHRCHASLQNLKEVSPSPLPWPTGSSWGRTSRPIGWGALSRYWVFAQYCMPLVSISSFLCSCLSVSFNLSLKTPLSIFQLWTLKWSFPLLPLSNTHHTLLARSWWLGWGSGDFSVKILLVLYISSQARHMGVCLCTSSYARCTLSFEIYYIAKSIWSPPSNECFDYFSNFHEYKS